MGDLFGQRLSVDTICTIQQQCAQGLAQFEEQAKQARRKTSGKLHQALLSGLLSNLGTLLENREYLGARNRKFMIHPGSGLAKKTPKWVMAFELIETTKLFARTVAKIDPQWIEPQAQHLVKSSYSEPHWEMKRAQVVAFEQVTLFGLPIVNRRRVHYGPIAPAEARELLIRRALVEGEYRTKADFFAYNRSLIEEVEDLEDRARKRDILSSIPGIGQIAAAAILTFLPEIGALGRKQAGSLAGLVPHNRESGQWKGKSFISGGRKPLRDALYMPALVAMRFNPDLKAVNRRAKLTHLGGL